MRAIMRDLRFAARSLKNRPGFTAIIVVIIGLGIGGTTIIFNAVDAVLLRPLPFFDAERLVVPMSLNLKRGTTIDTVPYADFLDWRAEKETFQHVAAYTDPPFDLSGTGEPERIPGAAVSEWYFELLAAPALCGRTFLPEDHQPGAGKVAILSRGLWQRRFGSDPGVIGTAIKLSGDQYRVIGVMPPEARWPPNTALWVPLTFGATPPPDVMRRDSFGWHVLARLRSGVTLAQGRAQLKRISRSIAREAPALRGAWDAELVPIHHYVVGPTSRRTLWVLMGSVGILLLIACANIAHLMLIRSIDRSKEMAIRAAVGAGRSSLVRLLLMEWVLLFLTGGATGLLLATWGTDLLVTLSPGNVPRLTDAGAGWRAAGFALAVSLAVGLLFGSAPALRASKSKLGECLRGGGRGSAAGTSRTLARRSLVVAEVALSLVLLVGAGLMVKSFSRILKVDPGFRDSNLLTFRISLPDARYTDGNDRCTAFYQRARALIGALPTIESATVASVLPIAGGDYTHRAFTVVGQPPPPAGPEYIAAWNAVAPDYFTTLGIPILKGREFTDQDRRDAPPVMIINKALARQMFPDEDPVGKYIGRWRVGDERYEIVGVVDDVSFYNLVDRNRPLVYVPQHQDTRRSMVMAVRTSGDPLTMAAAIRGAVWSIESDVAVAGLAPMKQFTGDFLARPRFLMLVLSGFAVFAFALALAGIYGVLSHQVRQRRNEIGIRMALGARGGDVLHLVLRHGVVLIVTGLAVGLLVALGCSRVLGALLYDTAATDATTFAGASLLLTAVALLACYIPARRATRIDPMTALRCE